MRRREWMAISFAAAAACGSGEKADEPEQASKWQPAADVLEKSIADGVVTNAALTVWQGPDHFEKGFGAPYDPELIFLLASISKPMTATGVMTLYDAGKLTLDDPVMKFIPEFSEGDRAKVTIKHLLTHTSGLPDQLPNNSELRKANAPLSEFVAGAVKVPLKFEPGTQYSYQSMGILLAAEVCQRITGEAFEPFMKRAVFDPLGMTKTSMGLGDFVLDKTARSQTETAAPEAGAGDPTAKDWDWNSPYWRKLGAPWGGAHATAPDVARFMDSFLHPGGKALKVETAKLMLENQTPNLDVKRGLGFGLGEKAGSPGCSEGTFGHTGSTGTLTWADPETDTICVVLTTLPAGTVKPHPRELAAEDVAKAMRT
ncbi:MAG: beta-lactamase family protein [Bryobacterales bacterium]|nr:beta-lactamase family protein [Bryobacterales bacterium]